MEAVDKTPPATVEKSPIGQFFARIGRRVRSKSPTANTGKAALPPLPTKSPKKVTLVDPSRDSVDSGFESGRPPTARRHCRAPSTGGRSFPNGVASAENSPARDIRDPSASRFGNFMQRLSKRSKKTSLSDSRDSSLEVETRDEDFDGGRYSNRSGLKERSALSETDLRLVTVSRGSTMPQTPLAGCSQFRSEDQLATPVAETPGQRVPSYVRVSCALSGYNTRSPLSRFTDFRSQTDRTPMGKTLVERRLQAFAENTPPDGWSKSARCAGSPIENPRGNLAESPVANPSEEMGSALSTPTVKSLAAQFDRLQICTPARQKDKENVHPHAIIVDPDAYACDVSEHEVHETSELPNGMTTSAVLASTQRTPARASVSEAAPTPAKARSVAQTRESTVDEDVRPSEENRKSLGEVDLSKTLVISKAEIVVAPPPSVSSPLTNGHLQTNGTTRFSKPTTISGTQFERSGAGFAKLLAMKRAQLQALSTAALKDLEDAENGRVPMPESAMDALRLAAGKAGLLLKKKLTKFDELNPVEGDPQPATVDDLEGYWALVDMELEDIESCFERVEKLRASDWKAEEEKEEVKTARPATKAPPRTPARPQTAAASAKAEEERAKRRKAMAEARARVAAQKPAEDMIMM